MTAKVHGIRDVGHYKLYEKRIGNSVQIFIGHQPAPQKIIDIFNDKE